MLIPDYVILASFLYSATGLVFKAESYFKTHKIFIILVLISV